jgi:N-acetyl sugar amidotransferase
MDTTDPNIRFDEKGVCERCGDYYNHILPMWNKGENKQTKLNAIVDKIKKAGKGRQYDCILGLSGGFDSSYMLHFTVKELKLRPLVFHVDAGWDTGFAEENIKKMVTKLGIELKTEVINWNEIRDFQVAFFKSGVPHLDTPQDHAFMAVLDRYGEKNKIKYILNGGNISTEVIVNPNAWGYWGTDMAQIKDILKRFGTVEMKTYPFTNIIKRKVIIPYVKGVKVVKLLNYIPYVKRDAEKILIGEYEYIPYAQKHFEDVLTKFIEGYWLPKRFGYDVRKPQFSSLILTGQMTRDEAVEKLKYSAIPEQEAALLFEQIAKKLEISADELRQYFTMPLKTYRDYKNQEFLFTLGAKIMYCLKLDRLIRK